MSNNVEDLLRLHHPIYRQQAEERDLRAAAALRQQELLAAEGKLELGMGTSVRGPRDSVQSAPETVRALEKGLCEGVPLHGLISSEMTAGTKKFAQKAPVSREFWHLASTNFGHTVRLLDKEDLDNSCTVQNERSLVHDTALADEGNLLSAMSFEDNSATRSPTRRVAKETLSPRQLEEEEEIKPLTPAPDAQAGTTYMSPLEFAETARIERIRCQLYYNNKLGSKSQQRSRFIVKITITYNGSASDIWYLRLLSEQRYFWRKKKKQGMSRVETKMVAMHDEIKEVMKGDDAPAIAPCIGHIFDNHAPVEDCVGLLAQEASDVPIVMLLLRGTLFVIDIDQASKGSKSLASDCGIGYWHPYHERQNRNADTNAVA